MNEASLTYWNEFWGSSQKPSSVSAWQFGAEPDKLASLVIAGKKRATCSCKLLYDLENEPLPKEGDYSIILDSEDQPVAIIRTTEVEILPMNEVTEDFAISEGEGSYEEWWDIHVKFFTSELKEKGLSFSDEILLVCERFELIDCNEKGKTLAGSL
ncbi:MAG TPA: ASCH domain-containing protein [Bacillus bacterium]|uniref:ASCH domain-containing protein n=1 Tax=Siminovitchia fordii TaxID=254759 RepID=UPI0003610E49|nr:ASCH domain-containing protein [Siminovitchia fordii]HBZ11624.1 ASCH domain-containing protein [Bacillus sp. (in: firmicutes)]